MPVDMELETVLRPHQYEMPPYPPKVITLANGKKMVVRQAVREDVPAILKSVHPLDPGFRRGDASKDFLRKHQRFTGTENATVFIPSIQSTPFYASP